jgi:chromosome segregation ATPase
VESCRVVQLEAGLSASQAELQAKDTRIVELEAERDGARATNRALISRRGELWAEARTLKSYIAKLEADKSISRRRLETKNGRLIGERIAELEVEIERLKSERALMLDFIKWLYIGRLREIDEHYQKLPDDLKTAIQEMMTLENSHDPL